MYWNHSNINIAEVTEQIMESSDSIKKKRSWSRILDSITKGPEKDKMYIIPLKNLLRNVLNKQIYS